MWAGGGGWPAPRAARRCGAAGSPRPWCGGGRASCRRPPRRPRQRLRQRRPRTSSARGTTVILFLRRRGGSRARVSDQLQARARVRRRIGGRTAGQADDCTAKQQKTHRAASGVAQGHGAVVAVGWREADRGARGAQRRARPGGLGLTSNQEAGRAHGWLGAGEASCVLRQLSASKLESAGSAGTSTGIRCCVPACHLGGVFHGAPRYLPPSRCCRAPCCRDGEPHPGALRAAPPRRGGELG